MTGLRGKKILVTGAARGIGLAIAHRLANGGAEVAINDINAEAAEEEAHSMRSRGWIAVATPGDISDPERAHAIVHAGARDLGGLSGLVNNAGIEHRESIENYQPRDWRRVMAVNLEAPFFLAQACLPHFRRAQNSSIVNIASVAVIGTFGQPAYDASKGGLVTLTRSMATELGRYGVRANAVCPGFIETAMLKENAKLVDLCERHVRTQPLQRMGQPYEVANAVAWLSSDEASYVTGTTMYVDGGWVRK